MRYISVLLALLLALGAAGCQQRQPELPLGPQKKGEEKMALEAAPAQKQEEQQEEASGEAPCTALLNGEPVEAGALWDKDPETSLSLAPGDRLEVTIKEGEANALYLSSVQEEEFTVEAQMPGGETARFTEVAPGPRWCALPKGAGKVALTFPQGAVLSQLLPVAVETEKLEQLAIVGYWPVEAAAWEAVKSHLNNLTDLVVNTGCYWRIDGALEAYPSLKAALNTLNSLPEGSRRPTVWCTINPLGELIRKGTAGEPLDSPEKRQALAQTMVDFCLENNIDGVDIDWETPTQAQWPDFSSFIVTLSQALHKEGLGLSLALYPGEAHLSQEAIKAVDRVNVMAYDQFDSQGRHATYEAARDALDHFISIGFSAEQLCLGIPAYGRPLDQSAQWPAYRDARLEPGENLQNGVYYNSPQLGADKTMLAAAQGLQGLMVYQLGTDRPGDDPQAITAVVFQSSRPGSLSAHLTA